MLLFRRRAGPKGLAASLLQFNRQGDAITIAEALASTLIIADSGAGKSSAILPALICSAMRCGWSTLHTTVKREDADAYAHLARRFGREPIVFSLESGDTFNPLAWTQRRGGPGASTEALTQLAMAPLRVSRRGASQGDPFWVDSAEDLVRCIVEVLRLADEPLSYRKIVECLNRLPRSVAETRSGEWRSLCPFYPALLEAQRRAVTQVDRADLDLAAEILLRRVPATPEKTLASTLATYTSACSGLIRGLIGAALNAEHDTWTPDALLTQQGVSVILDIPTHVHGVVGSVLQRAYLTAVQEAILSRDLTQSDHCIGLFIDEWQELLDHEHDARFLRTARGVRACAVLATQTVGNIRDGCSAARDPSSAAEKLLGLCAVKVFGATNDPATGAFASQVASHTPQARLSMGESKPGEGKGRPKRGEHNRSVNISRDLQPDLPAYQLGRLRRGGSENRGIVEAFVMVSGKVWKASRRPTLKVAFRQELHS